MKVIALLLAGFLGASTATTVPSSTPASSLPTPSRSSSRPISSSSVTYYTPSASVNDTGFPSLQTPSSDGSSSPFPSSRASVPTPGHEGTSLPFSSSSSSDALCANPLFENFQLTVNDDQGETCTIDLKNVRPAPFPSNGTVCTAFAGQQSCCSAFHLDEITRAANFQSRQIADARAYLNQQVAADQAANAANAALNVTNSDFVQDCTSFGYSAGSCATLSAQVESFQSLKHQFELDSLTCLSALENYTTGMLCFACTTEWSQYVHSGNSTIDIHTHTCTSVAASCSAVNTDFVAMYLQYSTILQTIFAATNNTVAQSGFTSFPHHLGGGEREPDMNPISQWVLGYPDLCGGNITNPGTCDYYICDNWIGGLGVKFPSANLPSSVGVGRMLATRDMSSAVNDLKPSTGSLIAGSRQMATAAAYSTNNYVSTGYDPICVASGGTNCAAGAVAPLSTGAVAGIVVGAVVGVVAFAGVAGAAVFIIRRRLTRRASIMIAISERV